ncbi:uncharacterized protein [Mobula birostris]|uniref:uncharacterized protein isoform X3 n=2 Tax=Mobula birostris TaxID=1983395 RepID=UPI003B2803D4
MSCRDLESECIGCGVSSASSSRLSIHRREGQRDFTEFTPGLFDRSLGEINENQEIMSTSIAGFRERADTAEAQSLTAFKTEINRSDRNQGVWRQGRKIKLCVLRGGRREKQRAARVQPSGEK